MKHFEENTTQFYEFSLGMLLSVTVQNSGESPEYIMLLAANSLRHVSSNYSQSIIVAGYFHHFHQHCFQRYCN